MEPVERELFACPGASLLARNALRFKNVVLDHAGTKNRNETAFLSSFVCETVSEGSFALEEMLLKNKGSM